MNDRSGETSLHAKNRFFSGIGQIPLVWAYNPYKDERRALIRDELRSLDSDEQRVYAYLALEDLRESRMASASLTEKVEAGLWESAPVLFSKMVELFATEKYDSDWGVEKAFEH